jgi:hypothetical protein
MPRIDLTSRKIKVTTVLDPAPFVGMPTPSDNAPSRTELAITVAGRSTYKADVATRSMRRVLAAIAEHGPDGVAILVQGALVGDEIAEAGLAAQPKVPKPAEKEAA